MERCPSCSDFDKSDTTSCSDDSLDLGKDSKTVDKEPMVVVESTEKSSSTPDVPKESTSAEAPEEGGKNIKMRASSFLTFEESTHEKLFWEILGIRHHAHDFYEALNLAYPHRYQSWDKAYENIHKELGKIQSALIVACHEARANAASRVRVEEMRVMSEGGPVIDKTAPLDVAYCIYCEMSVDDFCPHMGKRKNCKTCIDLSRSLMELSIRQTQRALDTARQGNQ